MQRGAVRSCTDSHCTSPHRFGGVVLATSPQPRWWRPKRCGPPPARMAEWVAPKQRLSECSHTRTRTPLLSAFRAASMIPQHPAMSHSATPPFLPLLLLRAPSTTPLSPIRGLFARYGFTLSSSFFGFASCGLARLSQRAKLRRTYASSTHTYFA